MFMMPEQEKSTYRAMLQEIEQEDSSGETPLSPKLRGLKKNLNSKPSKKLDELDPIKTRLKNSETINWLKSRC